MLQPSELQGEISEKSQVLLGEERFKEEVVSVIVTFKTVSSLLNFDFLMITYPHTQLGAKYQCGQNYQEVTKFPVLSRKMIRR